MSNMSYCRFQNTLGDLEDCEETLYETENSDDLSKDELCAAIKLIEMCQRIAEETEDLLETLETELGEMS